MYLAQRAILLVLVGFFLAACATARPQPTPEQLAMQQKLVEAFTSRMANAPATSYGTTQPEPAPLSVPSISEAELAEKVSLLPTNNGGDWSLISDGADGFNINGQAFVSPRGRVVDYGADERTGRIVYISQESRNALWVAMAYAGSPEKSVNIGRINRQQGGWRFTSVTGEVVNGGRFYATSLGVIMVRPNAGFHYIAGKGTSSFAVTKGFHIAPFQPGDIGSTKHILLERDDKNGSELTEAFSSLGNIFGLSKHTDYGLLNIATNTFVPIEMSLDDKQVGEHSNCRTTDRVGGMNIRTCDTLTMRESFYAPDGSRNSKHPYWNLYWGQSKRGNFLLAKEGSLGSKLIYVDLNNHQRFVTFKRTLGINDFAVQRYKDGRIALSGKLGFKRKQIDDLDAFILQASPLAAK